MGSIVCEIARDEVELCLHPLEALDLCAARQYDLVLVDHVMPEMDGIEFTQALRLRPAYRSVPMIMVTSDIDKAVRIEAIRAGANDFLTKPFDPIELQARVTNLLALRRAQVELANHANQLAREVQRATAHLLAREEEIIWRLARAIEYRDGDTGEHVSRVAQICQVIAEGLGLSAEHARMIYLAAPLHDIGKIGISDAILNKPGKFTPEERAAMREHVNIGARILADADSDLIRTAELIAQSHHERWDGSGYPYRLAGEAIPIEARIVALADVFDALCSERPYKRAWPVNEAYAEIMRCSGTHFDPGCVASFKAQWSQICAIMTQDKLAA
ncbi:putative two-component system response regulator [Devosia crocina]|uniref:Putative two-component system response regulator n=1 Tax=Devosia crocina TaxID=429728 RepID=A0A1I7NUF3_9HYPH|nr:putative two-component system response regulator [Devosia crocina]